MSIQYGDTVLVTKRQLNRLQKRCSGLIAFRIEGKDCYIKIWTSRPSELRFISQIAQFDEENIIIPKPENTVRPVSN